MRRSSRASQPILELSNTALQLDVISREAQVSEQVNNLTQHAACFGAEPLGTAQCSGKSTIWQGYKSRSRWTSSTLRACAGPARAVRSRWQDLHLPRQLSGGQQQLGAVARAIVGKPQLILTDEPTGNLDSANGEDVMRMLVRLHMEGATIVMVTHSALHAQYAQRTIRMLDGRVLSESSARVADLVA